MELDDSDGRLGAENGYTSDEAGGDSGLSGRSYDRRTQARDKLDDEGWGKSKRDYYNADTVETEGDALEEEEEAIRLQKKKLEGMTDADFGLDDAGWHDRAGGDDGHEEEGTTHEILLRLELSDAMPIEEKTRVLRTKYPELRSLADEFLDLQPRLEHLHLDAAAAATHGSRPGEPTLPVATAKWVSLGAYLAALSMYFALISAGPRGSHNEGKARAPEELRKHAIMEYLLRCRKAWAAIKDVEATPLNARLEARDNTAGAKSDANGAQSYADQAERGFVVNGDAPKKKKRRKSQAQRAAEVALVEADAQKRERLRKMQARLAKLAASDKADQEPPLERPRPRALEGDEDSDLGEETALAEHEAAEKAKRKKSLRFYTAQIAQKANKRDSARRNAGGDTDIPYRERFQDRQLRLNAEAEARGKKNNDRADAAPLGDDDEDDDAAAAAVGRQAADDDYYAQIAQQTHAKAADKAARAQAHHDAKAIVGSQRLPGATAGPDGKRGLSYAIEKNKGITPSGKRNVRNPRVKKRRRYDDKLKKLNSVRPVYKGGEGRGGYGGELTGIKTNLVKSVKF